MEYDIEIHKVEKMSLADFGHKHELTMVLTERRLPEGNAKLWKATFRDTGLSTDETIIARAHGNGPTANAAMEAYANLITLKTLITMDGREIEVPRLVSADKINS